MTEFDLERLIGDAGFSFSFERGEKRYYKREGSKNQQGANLIYRNGVYMFYPFSNNGNIEGGKAYTPSMLLIEVDFNGDGKECYQWLISNGYGQRIGESYEKHIQSTVEKIRKGDPMSLVKADLHMSEDSEKQADRIIEIAQNRIQNEQLFWTEKDGKVQIAEVEMKFFLENHGFRKFKHFENDQNSVLVHLNEEKRIIREVNIEYVKNYLLEFVNSEDLVFPIYVRHAVMNRLMKMTSNFFNKGMFEWLQEVTEGVDIQILKDDFYTSYVFFQNYAVKITKTKPEIVAYSELPEDKYIWESSIIRRDISLMNLNDSNRLNSCEYFRFVKRLCGIEPDTDHLPLSELPHLERLMAFITTIGYMCHACNDRTRAWAVIIAEDIMESSEGGGTGKGIFLQSLTHVRKSIYETGKSFDPTSQFAFQKWMPGTDIYMVDDVDRRFDFESMYNVITDGGTVERKFRDAITIPFEMLPKFIFTTNYGDLAQGRHGERRRKVLLVGQYFSSEHQPIDEFGHRLFDEWDDSQWMLFYNFIFECISQYLKDGVIDYPDSENMKVKTFTDRYGMELFNFYRELTSWQWDEPMDYEMIKNRLRNEYPNRNDTGNQIARSFAKFCDDFGIEYERGQHPVSRKITVKVVLKGGVKTYNKIEGYDFEEASNSKGFEGLPF